MPRQSAARDWTHWFLSNKKIGIQMAVLCFGLFLTLMIAQKAPANKSLSTLASPSDAVRQAYIDLLGREPDPPGMALYVGAINSGELTIEKMRQELKHSPRRRRRVMTNGIWPSKILIGCVQTGSLVSQFLPTCWRRSCPTCMTLGSLK